MLAAKARPVTFSPAFTQKPLAWVRSAGTAGIEDLDPYDYDEEVTWGKITALSATGCTVETYVYEVLNLPSSFLHIVLPILPGRAAVALTMVGVPVGGGGPFAAGRSVAEGPADHDSELPVAFRLHQNRPNPFRRSTSIRFDLPSRASVRLEIFDANGRLVAIPVNGTLPVGIHTTQWSGMGMDGRRARAGVYLCRMRAGTFSDMKKMVLMPE